MQFFSTNRSSPQVGLARALLLGQAPDKGLFLPAETPPLPEGALRPGLPYPERAAFLLEPYTAGLLEGEELRRVCREVYNFPIPIEEAGEGRFILRLDQGPTASFKDFGARFMARLLERAARGRGGETLVLTATSGDTGSAVAHALHGIPGIRAVVLFPEREVSPRQRKQMTTLGGNVTAFAYRGKFDQCQALVKQAFADPDLSGLHLTSANSISVGRLLPQSVYYVHAAAEVLGATGAEKVLFAVPSGNFGNLTGGILALRRGLPAVRFLAAVNENDEFPRFLETGVYEKVVPSRACLSSAMNVGHPSNLARLAALYRGWMDEEGRIRKPPDLEWMRREISSAPVSDEETRAAMARAFRERGVVLEPHGAVAWSVLETWLSKHPEDRKHPAILLETAHPAKFPGEVKRAVGKAPHTPPSLEGLEEREESFEFLDSEYDRFKKVLLERFGA